MHNVNKILTHYGVIIAFSTVCIYGCILFLRDLCSLKVERPEIADRFFQNNFIYWQHNSVCSPEAFHTSVHSSH